MTKNIIICCDGTNNEIQGDLSNVFKLYRILSKNAEQIVYYDPGIGTLRYKRNWMQRFQQVWEKWCLATGIGLDRNVLRAYTFLIEAYEPGDQVYLFGFSRGAYTIRVLAGFIHLIGLLSPEQKNLCGYAYKAYKEASAKGDLSHAWRFPAVVPTRSMPIKFMGVWDTVNSVIIPRWLGIFVKFRILALPYTLQNPHVEIFRQANALDEYRRMFRLCGWKEGQKFKPNAFSTSEEVLQDSQQVWFCGCHSDVGGGYPETESGLAKYPLQWMTLEAKKAGIKINQAMFNHLVLGKQRSGGKREYVAPDATAMSHNSMTVGWRLIEYLPKKVVKEDPPSRKTFMGWYIPGCEPRTVPEGAYIHVSVMERRKQMTDYRAIDFPEAFKVVDDVNISQTDA